MLESRPLPSQARKLEIEYWLKEKKHTRSPWGEKLDSNGYAESLLDNGGYCFTCSVGGTLARHEVFGGADRQTSKAVGMWTQLCPYCHAKIHQHGKADETLKATAQVIFEQNHTHEEFIALFGENYI